MATAAALRQIITSSSGRFIFSREPMPVPTKLPAPAAAPIAARSRTAANPCARDSMWNARKIVRNPDSSRSSETPCSEVITVGSKPRRAHRARRANGGTRSWLRGRRGSSRCRGAGVAESTCFGSRRAE